MKVAVLMIEYGLGADDARALLESHGDRLEAALEAEKAKGA